MKCSGMSSSASVSACTLPRLGGENLSLSGKREKSFWVQIAGGPAAAICASLFSGSQSFEGMGIRWNFALLQEKTVNIRLRTSSYH